MKMRSTAVCAQSGAISTVLIGLVGFVAGALTVGLLALTRPAAPIAAETARLPASSGVLRDAVPTTAVVDRDRSWSPQADPFPWPFESATPRPVRAPGSNRPDRLSAPEGWTHDQAKQSD
ncbi:MAG TPA: hypothetical protein VNW98_05410 [Burkholderiaceae bacterium]|jgi:hypothetical protein|nr:hypothetical protein [Burkholderiaceae bacterium]